MLGIGGTSGNGRVRGARRAVNDGGTPRRRGTVRNPRDSVGVLLPEVRQCKHAESASVRLEARPAAGRCSGTTVQGLRTPFLSETVALIVADRKAEVVLLDDVFQHVQDLDPDQNDIILLGDFNLQSSHAAWDELKAIEGVIPLFDGDFKTTLGTKYKRSSADHHRKVKDFWQRMYL